MKLQLRAKFDGDIELPPGAVALAAEWDDVRFEVAKAKDGGFEVAATKQVPPNRVAECVGTIVRVPGKPDNVVVDYPKDISDELLSYLHKFESHVAFAFQEARINEVAWEEHQVVFIPETDAEKAAIVVNGITVSTSQATRAAPLTPKSFDMIVTRMRSMGDVHLPMAFFREGKLDHRAGKFASAFCNFYFVVEDFFGGERPYRESDVVASFKANADAMRVFESALKSFQQPDLKEHWQKLLTYFKEAQCEANPVGLGRLLVRMRGRLRHYSRRNAALAGTPFEDSKYQSLALLGLHVANLTLLFYVVSENRKRLGLPPQ